MLIYLLVSCLSELDATCSSDRGCPEGACVNGICQGPACEIDSDCPGGEQCASVLGSMSCARPCAADGDCFGESTCTDVPSSSASDAELVSYCF
ncbi:MAG TPA: hypothetical protein QGF58_01655 [Myxococcota bacterium]|jgi:hypothetical protein|nr:hypothetical protein [Myxococcota bacterium]